MGNPLLDISATVKPELLTKHNLKSNDAILTEDEAIFNDLAEYKVDYIAGGATQNSIRVAQWILEKPNSCSYFGSVGQDKYSDTLEKCAKDAGVNVKYQRSEHPTGRCAVLITGHDRSLVTKLDAANHFTTSHLDNPDNWKVVETSQVHFVSYSLQPRNVKTGTDFFNIKVFFINPHFSILYPLLPISQS